MRLDLRPEVEAMFASILELSKAERESFLARECGGDPLLRAAVETLLRNYEAAGTFLEPRHATRGQTEARRDFPATLGRYQIIRLLGEGGMGLVYEAEQQQPRRTVALKVIKGGFASPEMLRRFELESQALGSLQHPGIAQIYEAGTADNGFGPQPYFAMEFIRGASLLQFAEARRLSTRECLELAIKICVAVHHAHERGLIHRDLKPGNILVDDAGQPKILDFGVACVTDRQVQTTCQTGPGELVGTLEYMSPEQVGGDPLEVDTRSDVYALGVILFELLAGRLPYFIGRELQEAMQTIREKNPVRLSSINRTCRGDIETIVGKAMEKDKTRRYSSAAELAADIQRYLLDEPIIARPPSRVYHLRKFARRHKVVVAATAAVFAVLCAALAITVREAVRAQRAERVALRERDRAAAAEQVAIAEKEHALRAERAATAERNRALVEQRRADTESAAAKAVNEFLQNDLLVQASANTQARPGTKPDPDLKVRTALDRAAARIGGKFENQPLIEASLRQTIGQTYKDLGLYPDARRQIERALQIRRELLGERDQETMRSMSILALVCRYAGEYSQAESLGTRVLELQSRVLGGRHRDTMATMSDLMELYRSQGKYPQAESLGTKLLSARRAVLGEGHPDTQESMNNLALLYLYEGKYGLAEPLLTRALELGRRRLGESHPEMMTGFNNLAVLYHRLGKYAQAEALLNNVLQSQRQILGEDHPSTLLSSSNLAMTWLRQGRFKEAEQLYTKALEARRRTLGPEHPSTLFTANSLALTYLAQGQLTEARPLILSLLDVKRRVLGNEHPETLNSVHALCLLFVAEENYPAVEPLLVGLLETQQRVLGQEHPDTLNTMSSLARLYFVEGKYAQAGAIAKRHFEARRHSVGAEHPLTLSGLALLGKIEFGQKRFADADWTLRQALNGLKTTSPGGWERYDAESMLGGSLAAQGKFAEAEPLLLSGYRGLLAVRATIPWESRSALAASAERTDRMYAEWGEISHFVQWQAESQVRR
jgi:eukaryotic-like serine/threonine-protein kinase